MKRRLRSRWPLAGGVLVVCVLGVGTILVLRDPSPDPPAIPECGGRSGADYACFESRYRRLTETWGTRGAFQELKRESKENAILRAVCHGITHQIGRTAARKRSSLADVYARGDTFCGAGYFHGAMETIVRRIGVKRALADAPRLCVEESGGLSPRSPYLRNCVHGLGHGFMAVQQNDVFRSLPACDRLKVSWERRQCYDGVFMQNVMSRDAPHYPSKHLRDSEPLYPCSAVERRYKPRCYERQTVQVLLTQNGDFGRAFELCDSAEREFRGSCYIGLGRDAGGYGLDNRETPPARAAETATLCHLGRSSEARERCVVGAAEFLLRQSESDAEARALCDALEARLHSVCTKVVKPDPPAA